MQNTKMKNRMSVSLLLLLTLVFVCFNPGYAAADLLGCMQDQASQGIFKVMACKITTTLFDIRKIVYILGGFGLIAFTFAAIFTPGASGVVLHNFSNELYDILLWFSPFQSLYDNNCMAGNTRICTSCSDIPLPTRSFHTANIAPRILGSYIS